MRLGTLFVAIAFVACGSPAAAPPASAPEPAASGSALERKAAATKQELAEVRAALDAQEREAQRCQLEASASQIIADKHAALRTSLAGHADQLDQLGKEASVVAHVDEQDPSKFVRTRDLAARIDDLGDQIRSARGRSLRLEEGIRACAK